MAYQVLLVEGVADVAFYSSFYRESVDRSIKVMTPRSVGARFDSKTNAIHVLPTLLSQLDDASIDNLGIVVDADYMNEHGLGFANTLDKIREKVVAHGFSREKRLQKGGFLFEHPDGLSPFGAWIMPDNKSDGMLEDFLQKTVVEHQRALHEHARSIVGDLREPLFKSIHRAKADVATWLSWQKMPGARDESTVGDHLIDLASPECLAFESWLRTVFP
jgi:hypothetical protein